MVPTFTQCSINQAGTQLYPGSLAVSTPQTFDTASTPTTKNGDGVGFATRMKPRTTPQPISARFGAGSTLTGRQPLVRSRCTLWSC